MKTKSFMNLLISLIITIITNILIIPIKASTHYNNFYGRDNIINILKNNSCKMCFNYEINWILLIIQIFFVFILCFGLLTIIDKRRNKHG